MSIKIIVTGVTGMVGEGVLLSALNSDQISEVLSVSRKPIDVTHPKLKHLVIQDFLSMNANMPELQGYDACFYCAGISSVGLSESEYHRITFDTTMHFAHVLEKLNPKIVFNYISGGHTDSSETGKVMWARIKGKTENALLKLFLDRAYNFRPALMLPVAGQKQFKGYNKFVRFLAPLLKFIYPPITLKQLTEAMIYTTTKGYSKPTLEVSDILKITNS